MTRLVRYFVDTPLVANLVTVALLLAGLLVLRDMTRTLMPGGAPSSVQVAASLPGASALDVERFVTFRLEDVLRGVRGIAKVTSTTQNGQVSLRAEIDPAVAESSQLVDEIERRIGAIRHRLPKELLPVEVTDRSANRDGNGIIRLVITGFDFGRSEHRRSFAVFREALERLPGVASTDTNLEKQNLYVRLDPRELERSGIPASLVRERVLSALSTSPLGAVRSGDEDIAVELVRPFTLDLEALRRLPLLVNRAGAGTTLGEVAQLVLAAPEALTRQTRNGRPYVDLVAFYDEDSDTIDASAEVRAFLAGRGKELLTPPLGVVVDVDTSDVVAHEIELLRSDGLQGVLLILLVLAIFFGWRVGLLAALDFPVSYLGTVVIMQLLGVNLNLMSLVAMILVAGVLVDDVVVVTESYAEHVARGLSPAEAAVRAVTGVAKPVLGMALTVTVTFLPLLLWQDDASFLVRPLPIIVIGAMGLSVFSCFCLLPSHLSHVVGGKGFPGERKPMLWLRALYERCLRFLLRWKALVFVGLLAVIAGAVALLMGPLRTSTDLQINSSLSIFVELEQSQSLEATARALLPVEQVITGLPKELVASFETELGESRFREHDYQGFKFARVDIDPPGNLIERDQRRFQIEALIAPKLEELRQKGGFRRLEVISQKAGETVQEVVTVYVSGGDRVELGEVLEAVRGATAKTEGVRGVFMDESRLQRTFHFTPDEAAVLSYGLSVDAVAAQIREHFSRQELTRLRTGGEEVDVFLDFSGKEPTSLVALAQLTVISDRGLAVPLRMLGRWREAEVLKRIEHEDRLRLFRIDVLYDQAQKTSEAVAEAIEAQLAPVRQSFPGYHISVKPDEGLEKGKRRTKMLLLMSVGLVYLVLVITLGSLLRPVVVLFAACFGFVGVVYAFFLHQQTFGILAVIGLIGLLAVVVSDSLVMTSALGEALARPKAERTDAVVAAAASRLRPFVITSLTTLAGVFPLAYGLGGNAGWLQPLVLAMGWGLIFAAILTLFFLPCLVVAIDSGTERARSSWRWMRRRVVLPSSETSS